MDDLFQVAYEGADIAGVDEVGRGPLAGDVVAAAVILDPRRPVEGLRDSKKLSATRREELAGIICANAIAWSIARASVEEIDRLNILQASLLAMKRAVEALQPQPGYVLVDGNRVTTGCRRLLPHLFLPRFSAMGSWWRWKRNTPDTASPRTRAIRRLRISTPCANWG